jgi:predicted transposase/invertase (TIGR01784 family)
MGETRKKRLNPLNDFAFQKSMGEKGDEEQLLSFLNSVLGRGAENRIAAVTILEDKELPADVLGGKLSRLDVLAALADGTKVNIEVQLKNEHNLEKRSVYYWALKYARDFGEGGDYADLVPVIAINIIDYGSFKEIDHYHASFHIREDSHPEVILGDMLEIHFLDMVKFRKVLRSGAYRAEDALERWLAYLNEDSPDEVIEEAIQMDAGIRQYETRMEQIRRTPEMMRAYDNYAKALSDYASGVNSARREGIAEGVKKGLKEGRKEGIKEGERQRNVAIAKGMKADGMPASQISTYTGLSAEEIAGL